MSTIIFPAEPKLYSILVHRQSNFIGFVNATKKVVGDAEGRRVVFLKNPALGDFEREFSSLELEHATEAEKMTFIHDNRSYMEMHDIRHD